MRDAISKRTVLATFVVVAMLFTLIPFQTDAASKIKLSKCAISLSYTADVYTGNKKTPRVTVKYKGDTLTKGKSYTVSYSNNVNPGTAKVTVKAKGSKYTGKVTKTFKIYVKAVSSIRSLATSGDSIQLAWGKTTGAKKYTINVTADGKKYKNGTYTTSSTSYKFTEVPAGANYRFSITAIAGPKNSTSITKSIDLKLGEITSLPKTTASGVSKGYRRCDVTWTPVAKATGYYVQEYNTASKSTSTQKIAESTATSFSFYEKTKGLSYQYKVQAYTTCNGKEITGAWSDAKTVTAAGTYIGQACSNYDGKAGDSSGNEVKKSSWTYKSSSSSPYNWTYVFRFKDPVKAEKAASMCEKGIANNNIGYCSNGTSTYGANAVQRQAAKYGYDLSKVSVKTGLSCGDLATLCVKYSGIDCKYIGSGLGVANELKRLSGDFICYSDSKYYASDAYLQRGDILVTAHSSGKNNHVCMVL